MRCTLTFILNFRNLTWCFQDLKRKWVSEAKPPKHLPIGVSSLWSRLAGHRLVCTALVHDHPCSVHREYTSEVYCTVYCVHYCSSTCKWQGRGINAKKWIPLGTCNVISTACLFLIFDENENNRLLLFPGLGHQVVKYRCTLLNTDTST